MQKEEEMMGDRKDDGKKVSETEHANKSLT
jgi:hypothetical protein